MSGPGYKKSVPVKKHVKSEGDQTTQDMSLQIAEIGENYDSVAIIPYTSVEKKDLPMEVSSVYHEEYVSQHKVDQLVIDFIVSGLHSPSLVERPEFQNLICGLQPERTIMSKVCLENIVADNASSFKRQLKDILSEVNHIAITADAWRVYNR